VRQRVRKGGHDVPARDLRRRFLPSLLIFFLLYLPLADEAVLFNAAARPPRVIARWNGRTALLIEPELYDHIQKQIETGR
jgi:predicted ABC-type ATPase